MTSESQESLPSKSEFVEFWKTQQSRRMHAVYPLSCLMVAAFVAIAAVSIDPSDPWAMIFSVGLIFVLVTFPFAFALGLSAQYRRFTRCRNCGLWIGADIQGKDALAQNMTEPTWLKVARTGRCIRCGSQLILDDQGQGMERN
ncbi:MAG: hypothetical protein ACRC16_22215 [Aeromonas salmonicida]